MINTLFLGLILSLVLPKFTGGKTLEGSFVIKDFVGLTTVEFSLK